MKNETEENVMGINIFDDKLTVYISDIVMGDEGAMTFDAVYDLETIKEMDKTPTDVEEECGKFIVKALEEYIAQTEKDATLA